MSQAVTEEQDAATTGTQQGERATGLGRLGAALLALCVLLAVAAVLLAVLWHRHTTSRERVASARSAAVAAGRQAVLNLDSISASTVDADIARISAIGTGVFGTQFRASAAELKTYVVQNKTVAAGAITAAALVRGDTTTATVLVSSQHKITDVQNPKGGVAPERWLLTMERHGGAWQVADLVPAGTQ